MAASVNNESIALLERYVLSTDKEKFFNTLVKGSDTYRYFRVLDHVNRYGLDLPADSKALLKEMRAKVPNSGAETLAMFKTRLLELEAETDTKKRCEMLRQFNKDYLGNISFAFSKPANVERAGGLSGNDGEAEHRHPANFNCGSEMCLEAYLKRFYKGEGNYGVLNFKPGCYESFDLKKVLEKDTDDLDTVLQQIPTYASIPNIVPILVDYTKRKQKAGEKMLTVPFHHFHKMTAKQMKQIGKDIPSILTDQEYVSVLFQKTFDKEATEVTIRTDDPVRSAKRRATLMEMHAWVSKLPETESHLSFAAQLLREVMEDELAFNSVKEKTFLAYIANPLHRRPNIFIIDKHHQLSSANMYWQQIHSMGSQWLEEKDLVNRCLENLIAQGVSLKPFQSYLDSTFLQKSHIRAKLLSGAEVEHISTFYTEGEIRQLREEKRLRFVPWNRREFKPNDNVDLVLEVKNVPSVTVTVFEIDTPSYYRRNKEAITEGVNLTGLMPRTRVEKPFTADPVVAEVSTFSDLFKPKRGVYVVEFVGGGLSSRALIRVGCLSVVRQRLSKGVLLHIVDEQKNVCAASTTGIVVGGRLLQPDANLGNGVLIPYGKTPLSETAVLQHEGYAELYSLYVPEENVEFDAQLVVNEEAITSGGSVELLLLPKVKVNTRKVVATTLKKASIVVTSTNSAGVKSMRRYNDVPIDKKDKGISVEYMVPPKTDKITVTMTAKFYSSANEKFIDLSSTKTIGINYFNGEKLFYSYYVTLDGADARLNVLGKDGEPYARHPVQVTMHSKYIQEPLQVTLETDDHGQILLARATDVLDSLTVRMLDNSNEWSYSFENNQRITTQPWSYDVVEGEEVCFPAVKNASSTDLSPYELVRVHETSMNVINDCQENLKLGDGLVRARDLKEGYYVFRYLQYPTSIRVTVRKGTRWSCSPQQYLVQEDSIVKLENQGACLTYKDLKNKDGNVSFKVLSHDMEAVEVHALAFTFFPKTLPAVVQALGALREMDTHDNFVLRASESVFLSEKKLSDETKYVLERRQKGAYMGNTLEKPPGLLKRHFVRETHEDAEQLAAEEDYKAVDRRERARRPEHARMYCSQPPQVMSALAAMPCAGAYGGGMFRNAMQRRVPEDNYNIEQLRPFLSKPGWSSFGLSPDASSGQVSFSVPADAGYTTLVLVIKDGRNSIVEWLPLDGKGDARHVASSPVTLTESKTANKVYAAQRTAEALVAGASVELKDARTTEFCFIDDVASLFDALQLVGGWNGTLEDWSFISTWGSMSAAEKLKKYDEFMCHELNVFAYFKDQEFFDVVVRPHLRSKSRKEVIDWVLLEDRTPLRPYLSPSLFFTITDSLERVLLLRLFAQELPDECRALSEALREKVTAVRPDPEDADRRFDTVLSGQKERDEVIAAVEEVAIQQSHMDMEVMVADEVSRSGAVGAAASSRMRMKKRSAPAPASAERAMLDMEACEDALDYAQNDDGTSDAPQAIKFRNLGVTNEYHEKQYYNGLYFAAIDSQFWSDAVSHFAKHGATGVFLPATFLQATGGLTEMLACVSMVDVPLTKRNVQSEASGSAMKLTASTNCLLLTKVIAEKGDERADIDVMVTQRFCDPFDLFTINDDGMKVLRNITEFLPRKLYLSRVLVTNASESEQRLSVVTEVPQGSIPVMDLEYTRSREVLVDPLTTSVIEFHFYFPRSGEFTCFPASIITQKGQLVGSSSLPEKLRVVPKLTCKAMETLNDVLNHGSRADVLAFMEKANLNKEDVFRFDSVYWLLTDAAFYKDVLALLRRRQHFDGIVWSFSIFHGDWPTFTEYLQYRHDATGWKPRLRVVDDAPEQVQFVSCGAVKMSTFEYLEYSPLVNARAHDVGQFKHNIRNREFRETYARFLSYLVQKSPRLTASDYVYLCTYLVLQDRIDTALSAYALIDAVAAGAELKLQYDYLTAYLDLYTDFPALRKAREICTQYLAYPVFTWRNRFIDIANQIAELDGETELLDKAVTADATSATDLNREQAAREGLLTCELDPSKTAAVKVTAANITRFTVHFYQVDLELLFSQDPFADVSALDYSFVVPNDSVTKMRERGVEGAEAVDSIPIPAALAKYNLIVQAVSGNLCASVMFFPTTMRATVNNNFGAVKVQTVSDGKPIARAYVKAFARRQDGSVSFYKDGYTDLRGAFEYASLHTEENPTTKVTEFRLLILSDEHGALITRADPPARVAVVDSGARAVASNRLQLAQQSAISNMRNQYYM